LENTITTAFLVACHSEEEEALMLIGIKKKSKVAKFEIILEKKKRDCIKSKSLSKHEKQREW